MKRNNSGAILFLVIIFSFILSAIGLAVIYLGGLDVLASRFEIDRVRVTNLADAGLEMGKAWIVSLNRFPEHRNRIPGQCLKQSYTIANNQLYNMGPASTLYGGRGRITVTVDPFEDNDVGAWGSSYNVPYYGRIGNYLVTSTARIRPVFSPALTTEKVATVVVRMWVGDLTGPAPVPAPPGSFYVYKSVANSWKEDASRRQ